MALYVLSNFEHKMEFNIYNTRTCQANQAIRSICIPIWRTVMWQCLEFKVLSLSMAAQGNWHLFDEFFRNFCRNYFFFDWIFCSTSKLEVLKFYKRVGNLSINVLGECCWLWDEINFQFAPRKPFLLKRISWDSFSGFQNQRKIFESHKIIRIFIQDLEPMPERFDLKSIYL